MISKLLFSPLSTYDIELGIKLGQYFLVDDISHLSSSSFGTTLSGYCTICMSKYKDNCPAHMGFYKLAYPIVNPLYEKAFCNVFNSLCDIPFCDYVNGNVYLNSMHSTDDETQYESSDENYYGDIMIQPHSCGVYKNTRYYSHMFRLKKRDGSNSTDKSTYFYSLERDLDKATMDIQTAYNFLKSLTPNQTSFIRTKLTPVDPLSYIIYYIPILPLYMRSPSVQQGVLKDDILTNIYDRYFSKLTRLSKESTFNPLDVIKYQYIAYEFYSAIIGTNKVDEGPLNGIRTFNQWISGKDGMLRKNLLGKRQHYSIRSVATSNKYLDVDEVGIPKYMMNKLNIKDGDLVLVLRYPTLDSHSLMGMRCKSSNTKTIQLNTCVCATFNADFDGDELNVFVCTSSDAIHDYYNKLYVGKNYISRRDSKPCFGPIQDSVIVLYNLSTMVNISSDDMNKFLGSVNINDVRIKISSLCSVVKLSEDPFYVAAKQCLLSGYEFDSGKVVLSSLFPFDFSYMFDDVVIVNGVYLSGVITAKKLWKSNNSILHSFYFRYSIQKSMNLITSIQQLADRVLSVHSFSLSVYDFICGNVTLNRIEVEHIKEEDQAYNTYILSEYSNIFSRYISNRDITKVILPSFQSCKNMLVKDLSYDNPLSRMINSGAKGDLSNLSQAIISIGQQMISGQRPISLDESIPDDIQNAGYCTNSYLNGLTVNEYFFQSKAGRDGNITLGLHTPESGYQQRQVTRFLEGVSVAESSPLVCLPDSSIVSFSYGKNMVDLELCDREHRPYDLEQSISKVLLALNNQQGI